MYGQQSGRPDTKKVCFYDEMESGWDLRNSNKIIVSLGDFNEHVGKCPKGFEGVHRGNGIWKRNAEGRRLLGFCDEKELCVLGFMKQRKRKSLMVLVDVRQKLILCLWEKNTECM